jgi:ribulose-5-phosphate 4-epimerase/fuculose-1-phosphate aldolase
MDGPVSIATLVALCQQIGASTPAWTQGAGGNVSLKLGSGPLQTLWIKASGFRLDGVSASAGLVGVPLERIVPKLNGLPAASPGSNDAELEVAYSEILEAAKRDSEGSGRPSMETGFHALLPSPMVVHFHSLAALVMSHEHELRSQQVEDFIQSHFLGRVLFVPPCRPGLMLSRLVGQHPDIDLFILQNHGLILQGEGPQVLDEWCELEQHFCREFGHEAILEDSAAQPTPMRIFFPDTAVFLDEIERILVPGGSVDGEPAFVVGDPNGANQDALEIWRATERLYHCCPGLAELPADISSSVADLPTERFRRSLDL